MISSIVPRSSPLALTTEVPSTFSEEISLWGSPSRAILFPPNASGDTPLTGPRPRHIRIDLFHGAAKSMRNERCSPPLGPIYCATSVGVIGRLCVLPAALRVVDGALA